MTIMSMSVHEAKQNNRKSRLTKGGENKNLKKKGERHLPFLEFIEIEYSPY